ncbi:MAG: hypothetical protein FWG32_05610 [Oscillospiraceae bacterium]|nr:hypothetical protein [Oscillospiraceae bacterium]
MATESFLKEVRIENDNDAEWLAEALESAKKMAEENTVAEIQYSNASKEEIRIMFHGNK